MADYTDPEKIQRSFLENLISKQQDLDPEISQLVDKYFRELAYEPDSKELTT